MPIIITFALIFINVSVFAAPFMYIHDDRGFLGLLDVESGDVSMIGEMKVGEVGVVLTDIAFDKSGDLYGISFTDLYRVNTTTAAATRIGRHGIPSGNALVFAPNGQLLAAGGGTTKIYSVNLDSGNSTELGDYGFSSAGDLAYSGGLLFLSSTSNELIEISVSPQVSGTSRGNLGFSNVYGLATGPDQTLYAVSQNSLLEVDIATGEATLIQNFSGEGFTQSFGSTFAGESTFSQPEIFRTSAGLVTLTWQGAFGGAFRVEFTPDLQGTWTASLVSPIYLGNGRWTWSTEAHKNASSMFYRVSSE